MNIQMIPLNRLTPSLVNVRKTGGMAIDDLAASIAAHGLLQNLQVRQVGKGKYEVIAGGRRLKALNLLAKSKTIAKSFEVGCNILEGDDLTEISLAENIMRESMHPADQFDAFRTMVANGLGIEDIAARFGCAPSTVKQRLKLASVNPSLIQLYRDEEMSLEQLMAFAVSDDHGAQMECWKSLPEWNRDARSIRNALMATHVEADDPRVSFVGMEAYVAAGGTIVRDLFDAEHEGYLADTALLDKLVAERLEWEAATVRAEGWLWVEIVPVFAYAMLRPFSQLESCQLPLTANESEELKRLGAEYDALAADDEGDEQDQRLDAIRERIDALTDGRRFWSDEQKAIAGVIVSVSQEGELYLAHGLVRASERAALDEENERPDPTTPQEPPLTRASGIPAKLVEELTAHRTAALQVMVAENSAVALAALAETLAMPIFYNGYAGTSLSLQATQVDVGRFGESLATSKAVGAFEALLELWRSRLPQQADDLAAWLKAQDTETTIKLIALCVSASLNAVQTPQDSTGTIRLAHAASLATAVGLDMTAWWQPTGASYLARISKARILEAVSEAKSPQAADNIAGLKKDALVARAEELLSGTGWLPAILRTPE